MSHELVLGPRTLLPTGAKVSLWSGQALSTTPGLPPSLELDFPKTTT